MTGRFVLKDAIDVRKMGMSATRYRHEPSGLVHLHVQRPDENRVFSLAFKTNAPNKTGVPHILEHTTLCGSKEYPVRDPFFKMQTRSLANFMNAMTGTDYTYYPFATTNQKDFENLQSVYMDSVFDPLLRELDFNQEGWRLEHEITDDATSPIIFKGVVYNEMKGQMSMPAYHFYVSFFQSVYPSLQYSAGDPKYIPDLRYQDLVQFHRDKYQPNNCFTFSYGNFDAQEAVAQLETYLDKLGADQTPRPPAAVLEPIALTSNKKVSVEGPVDPMFDGNKQYKVSLTWYVGKPQDLVQTMAWRVLSLLLVDGHASAFYQSLIDTGIGSEFTVNSGVDETPGQTMFTIGLQGLSHDAIDKFKATVFDTFKMLIQNGFPKQRLDAIIHQAEFADREIDAGFGLSLLSRTVQRAFHPNDDIMKVLDNGKLISDLKQMLDIKPTLFQDELQKMLDSPYFEFELVPVKDFEAKVAAQEAELLDSRVKVLTPETKKNVYERGLELQAAQHEKQDVSVLPMVQPKDISIEAPDYPTRSWSVGSGASALVRETPTNNITYLRILKNMSKIPRELITYLSVYSEALTNMGTRKHDMAQLEDLVKLYTGGIGASGITSHKYKEPIRLNMNFSASCLDENLAHMYELFAEVVEDTKWNNVGKLKSLLDANASNIMNALSQSGHRFAVGRASAAVSQRRALDDQIGGFSYVKLLKELAGMDESQLHDNVVPKFKQLGAVPWYAKAGVTFTLGMAPSEFQQLALLDEKLKFAPYSTGGVVSHVELAPMHTYVPLPFQVSYMGVAVKGAPYESRDSAALSVLATLLTHRYLHTEIREKGGAYGAGASYNAREGVFTMYSYRDPTPARTLDVVRGVGEWVANHQWTSEDILEGQIGVFQSLDAPISPRSEISFEFDAGMTKELRQSRRSHLLSVQPSDLNRVAKTYLGGLKDLDAGVCVIGPDEAFKSWDTIDL